MKTKLRMCDQMVRDEFASMFVINEEGKSNLVPIIWGTGDLVEAYFQKKTTIEDVIRLRLPIINICSSSIDPPNDASEVGIHYALSIWAMYMEESNQLVEQVLCKFTPIAEIKKNGYNLPMRLISVSNNLDTEPPLRIIRYNFDLVLQVNLKTLLEEP